MHVSINSALVEKTFKYNKQVKLTLYKNKNLITKNVR